MAGPTRRERLRMATVAEIKDGARRLLISGGPQAISLRAIARDMGMTAPAIYRYFPSLDALVRDLTGDLYDELREAVERARDSAGDDPVRQLATMARAFRHWSVTHPIEFALIFGTPVPGMPPTADKCLDPNHPAARFGALFVQALLDLWRRAPWPTPPAELLAGRLGDTLQPLRRSQGDLPVEVGYTFLSGWVRLYGLVSMEVFDHLWWAVTDPEALFEAELRDFVRGLTASSSPV